MARQNGSDPLAAVSCANEATKTNVQPVAQSLIPFAIAGLAGSASGGNPTVTSQTFTAVQGATAAVNCMLYGGNSPQCINGAMATYGSYQITINIQTLQSLTGVVGAGEPAVITSQEPTVNSLQIESGIALNENSGGIIDMVPNGNGGYVLAGNEAQVGASASNLSTILSAPQTELINENAVNQSLSNSIAGELTDLPSSEISIINQAESNAALSRITLQSAGNLTAVTEANLLPVVTQQVGLETQMSSVLNLPNTASKVISDLANLTETPAELATLSQAGIQTSISENLAPPTTTDVNGDPFTSLGSVYKSESPALVRRVSDIEDQVKNLTPAEVSTIIFTANYFDAPTGLYNQTAFAEGLQLEAKSAEETSSNLTVVAFKLTNFKNVNDSLGHVAGDNLLKAVSGVLQGTTRSTDMAARIGGNEFALILPNTTDQQAQVIVEKVLTGLQNLKNSAPENAALKLAYLDFAVSQMNPNTDIPAFLSNLDNLIYSGQRATTIPADLTQATVAPDGDQFISLEGSYIADAPAIARRSSDIEKQLTALTPEEIKNAIVQAKYIDPLTGIFNKSLTNDVIQVEMDAATKNQTDLSVAMLDLKKFGDLNDKFGRAEGDRALKEVADLLLKTVRPTDIPTRFGGDEFVVIFPDTNAEQAKVALQRYDAGLTALKDANPGDLVIQSININYGVVQMQPGDTVETFLQKADQEMYAMKGTSTINQTPATVKSAPQPPITAETVTPVLLPTAPVTNNTPIQDIIQNVGSDITSTAKNIVNKIGNTLDTYIVEPLNNILPGKSAVVTPPETPIKPANTTEVVTSLPMDPYEAVAPQPTKTWLDDLPAKTITAPGGGGDTNVGTILTDYASHWDGEWNSETSELTLTPKLTQNTSVYGDEYFDNSLATYKDGVVIPKTDTGYTQLGSYNNNSYTTGLVTIPKNAEIPVEAGGNKLIFRGINYEGMEAMLRDNQISSGPVVANISGQNGQIFFTNDPIMAFQYAANRSYFDMATFEKPSYIVAIEWPDGVPVRNGEVILNDPVPLGKIIKIYEVRPDAILSSKIPLTLSKDGSYMALPYNLITIADTAPKAQFVFKEISLNDAENAFGITPPEAAAAPETTAPVETIQSNLTSAEQNFIDGTLQNPTQKLPNVLKGSNTLTNADLTDVNKNKGFFMNDGQLVLDKNLDHPSILAHYNLNLQNKIAGFDPGMPIDFEGGYNIDTYGPVLAQRLQEAGFNPSTEIGLRGDYSGLGNGTYQGTISDIAKGLTSSNFKQASLTAVYTVNLPTADGGTIAIGPGYRLTSDTQGQFLVTGMNSRNATVDLKYENGDTKQVSLFDFDKMIQEPGFGIVSSPQKPVSILSTDYTLGGFSLKANSIGGIPIAGVVDENGRLYYSSETTSHQQIKDSALLLNREVAGQFEYKPDTKTWIISGTPDGTKNIITALKASGVSNVQKVQITVSTDLGTTNINARLNSVLPRLNTELTLQKQNPVINFVEKPILEIPDDLSDILTTLTIPTAENLAPTTQAEIDVQVSDIIAKLPQKSVNSTPWTFLDIPKVQPTEENYVTLYRGVNSFDPNVLQSAQAFRNVPENTILPAMNQIENDNNLDWYRLWKIHQTNIIGTPDQDLFISTTTSEQAAALYPLMPSSEENYVITLKIPKADYNQLYIPTLSQAINAQNEDEIMFFGYIKPEYIQQVKRVSDGAIVYTPTTETTPATTEVSVKNPTKPNIFGLQWNGFTDSSGNIQFPIGSTPPIQLGEVFDPNVEVQNILKLPSADRPAALVDFKAKLAYQQKGIVDTQTALEDAITKNPNILISDLTTLADSLGNKYGLTGSQTDKIDAALDVYDQKHALVEDILAQYPNPDDMYKAMFGRSSVGKIEVSKGPITIDIKTYEGFDYNFISSGDYSNPTSLPSGDMSDTTGGFFRPSSTLLPNTDGLVVVENGSLPPSSDVIPHEEQHALNNLLDTANIFPQIIPNVDPYLNMANAINSGSQQDIVRTLTDYLNAQKAWPDKHTMDEMLAYLKGGSSNRYILNTLTQPSSDGGLYDFYGKSMPQQIDTVSVLSSKTAGIIPSDEANIITQIFGPEAYKKTIQDGLNAFDTLIGKGYTRNEAVAALESVPLPDWPKTAQRAPVQTLPTRISSYVTGKILIPENLPIIIGASTGALLLTAEQYIGNYLLNNTHILDPVVNFYLQNSHTIINLLHGIH
jgi:diguanylate cyclase (GGDEF)-like protein